MQAEDNQELPLFAALAADRSPQPKEPAVVSHENECRNYGKYIVYVDESGDHGMQSIDEQYPVFVLAFCVFHKRHYSEKVVPALELFKFKHFGHDQIVLHENEIRKEKGVFKIFPTRAHKDRFMDDLTSIIEETNFIMISCVIDKRRLKEQQSTPSNPYHIALRYCLETLDEFLLEKNEQKNLTHVVVEQRGKKKMTNWSSNSAECAMVSTHRKKRSLLKSSSRIKKRCHQVFSWQIWLPAQLDFMFCDKDKQTARLMFSSKSSFAREAERK